MTNARLDLAVAICAIVGFVVILIALLNLFYTTGRWMLGLAGCA